MAMPIDFVLVRHGESEGNAAKHRTRAGEAGLITPAFLDRHSSQFRLTDKGREQATATRQWIREHVGDHFDRYYVSEYIRAMETAALLDLPAAEWYRDVNLRERDWGDIDVMSEEERRARFSEIVARRERDGLFWTPPNGESLATCCLRVDRVLSTLYREMDGKRVIAVCHGETMWCFRIRLERMTQQRFCELDQSKNPHDHINNCQVLWYSRRNPETGAIEPYLNWLMSVCPSDTSRSRNEWERIVRPRFSNAELLAEVLRAPRILNG